MGLRSFKDSKHQDDQAAINLARLNVDISKQTEFPHGELSRTDKRILGERQG